MPPSPDQRARFPLAATCAHEVDFGQGEVVDTQTKQRPFIGSKDDHWTNKSQID